MYRRGGVKVSPQGWVRGQVLNHRFTPLRPVEDSADRRVVLAQVSVDFQQAIPISETDLADGLVVFFSIPLGAPWGSRGSFWGAWL